MSRGKVDAVVTEIVDPNTGLVKKVDVNKKQRAWKWLLWEDVWQKYPDWLDRLESVGVPIAVSPVHGKDFFSDGRPKKNHRHCLSQTDSPVYYHDMLGWLQEAFSPEDIPIMYETRPIRVEERYLCHLDSRTKTKYDVADVIFINGYQQRFLGDRWEVMALQQIHDIIEDLGIYLYPDLANEIGRNYPDLLTTLLRYPAHFNNYCRGRADMVRMINELPEYKEVFDAETGEIKRVQVDKNTYVKYKSWRKRIGNV